MGGEILGGSKNCRNIITCLNEKVLGVERGEVGAKLVAPLPAGWMRKVFRLREFRWEQNCSTIPAVCI